MFRDLVLRNSPEPDSSENNDKMRIPVGRKALRPELRDFLPNVERNMTNSNQLQKTITEQPGLPTPPSVKASGDTAFFQTYYQPDHEHEHSSTFIAEETSIAVQDVFIVSAVRTPIAAFKGSFKTLSSVDLGVIAAKEAIKRAGVKPGDIEETVTGSVLTANCGQNVSRQIALKAGIPETSNAFTVNKVCSSSLKALILAAQSQQLGIRRVSLVVGTESMSQAPFCMDRADHSYGEIRMVDSIQKDGIYDTLLNHPMGLCAEKTAKDYHITREDQDKYAVESYKRAALAWKSGEYASEVVPVILKTRDGADFVVNEDEQYKRLIEGKVAALKPAFLRDGSGTITPANASSLNDGAAAAVVVSGAVVGDYKPLAKIIGYSEAGRAPVDFTIAPVNAVKQLLEASKLSVEDIARFEVNEAFAVTAICFMKELGVDRNKINARGGAVALGHPIGMSGIRIVTTLIYQLQPGEYGIAAICNGGGEATAVLVQKM